MKKNKKTFMDWVSVVIAIIGAMIFGAAFVGCYVGFFMHPSIYTFVGAFWASVIPGFLTYGIVAATIDFLRNK